MSEYRKTLKDPNTGTVIVVGNPNEAARLESYGYTEVKEPRPERVFTPEQTQSVAKVAEKPKNDK